MGITGKAVDGSNYILYKEMVCGISGFEREGKKRKSEKKREKTENFDMPFKSVQLIIL
jgi:hypothetical protein